MTQDLIPAATTAVTAQAATPADLLRIAVESGADLDRLERLMALQEKWEAGQARKAYIDAMSRFKKSPPHILKSKAVNFTTTRGTTSYMHATLGDVAQPIIEGLAAVGISHRWDVQQPDGGMITVTCILTHEQGHSEQVTMKAGRDDSGGKNSIQQVASTITYLERYTLLSITGIATHDMPDDDGHKSEAKTEEPATKTAAVAQALKGVKLDDVLKAYQAATTPEAVKQADAQAGKLASEADKAIARQVRKDRLAKLKAEQEAPPAKTFADYEADMRAAETQEARDAVLAGAVLTEDQAKDLEALWLELKVAA